MTPREKIKKYMEKKSEYLNQYLPGNMKFYVKADFDDVEKWSDKVCKRVWDRLCRRNSSIRYLCPQCIRCNNYCLKCGYKKVHGRCESNKMNPYDRIRLKLNRDDRYGLYDKFIEPSRQFISEIEEEEK